MAEEDQTTKPSTEHTDDKTPVLPRTYGLPGANTASKTTWPELVGLTAEEAEKKIKEERARVQIQVVPPNCFVTMDFRQNRVRLYVDDSGKVDKVPRIG